MRLICCVFALGCSTEPVALDASGHDASCEEAHATIDGWLEAPMAHDGPMERAVLDALQAVRAHDAAHHALEEAPEGASADPHLADLIEPLQHVSQLAEHKARTSVGDACDGGALVIAKESRALLASISPELDQGPWDEDGC